MYLLSWIRGFFKSKRRSTKRTRTFNRPRVEALEHRINPGGSGGGTGTHAPVTIDEIVETMEDTPYTFQLGDFHFSDPNDNPADNFVAVKVISLPANGALKLNNEDVAVDQEISVEDIEANLFTFLPADDENGEAYATWNFAVQDNSSNADTSATHSMTVDVTAVNDAPSFAASNPPEVDMSAEPIEVPNWVTSFNPGGGVDEASQTVLEYVVSNVSNPSLFSVLPAVSADGKLIYTLAPYVDGESTFDVQVRDGGGVANGGVNLGQPLARTIRVRGVVAPFTVNTLTDTADANPGDGRPRDASGNISLRAAIMEANSGPLYENAYTINFSVTGTIHVGAVLGALPPLTGRMGIFGPGSTQLTIARAANAANFRIFTIQWSGGGGISGLSITNGKATGAGVGGSGGGIANFATLALSGVTIYGNEANGNGGAIYNSGPSLTLENCNLYFNQAVGSGGAIYNDGTATISNTTISANSGWNGGGIYNAVNRQITINNGSQIYSNNATGTGVGQAGRGGGIANYGSLIMSDATLDGNTSVHEGGGLFSNGGSILTNVSIQNNQATNATRGKGAGIYVRVGETALTSGCTISGNTAAVTGGGNGICLHTFGFLDAQSPPNTITDDIVNDPTPE